MEKDEHLCNPSSLIFEPHPPGVHVKEGVFTMAHMSCIQTAHASAQRSSIYGPYAKGMEGAPIKFPTTGESRSKVQYLGLLIMALIGLHPASPGVPFPFFPGSFF